MNVSDQELIEAVINLWTKTLQKEGRRPLALDLERYGIPFSEDTYRRRFGNWRKVLLAAFNSVGKKRTGELKEIRQITGGKNTNAPRRKALSERRRFFVLKRDQFTCVLCGRSGVGVRLEVDHKTPKAKGGSDDLSNLQTLCFECNRGKRTDILL